MVAYDFSGGAGAGSPMDLIPNGQLAWVVITFRETKIGASKGTKYHDLELVLDAGQPYERRKVWHNLMDPLHAENSDAAKAMGMADITRILEGGRWGTRGAFDQATFAQQGGYQMNAFEELNGIRAAVKLKIEKGTGGYADKNVVAEFLSPNPVSSGHKGWNDLVAGRYNVTAAAPAAGGGFGAPAAAPAPAAGGFGAPATPAPAPQPQQQAPAAAPAQAPQGVAQTAPAPFGASSAQPSTAPTQTAAPAQASASTSPSNPPQADPNNWMAQANS